MNCKVQSEWKVEALQALKVRCNAQLIWEIILALCLFLLTLSVEKM